MKRKISGFRRIGQIYLDAICHANPDWRKRYPLTHHQRMLAPQEERSGLFKFQGRLSRRDFILVIGAYIFVSHLLIPLVDAILDLTNIGGIPSMFYTIWGIIGYFLFVYPFCVWRLHDCGKSALWVWVWMLILPSTLYSIADRIFHWSYIGSLSMLFSPILLFLMYLMFEEGVETSNKYTNDSLKLNVVNYADSDRAFWTFWGVPWSLLGLLLSFIMHRTMMSSYSVVYLSSHRSYEGNVWTEYLFPFFEEIFGRNLLLVSLFYFEVGCGILFWGFLVALLEIVLDEDLEKYSGTGLGVKDIQEKAEAGDAEAQYHLGLYYAEGKEMPQDKAEAIRLFTLAADQGVLSAKYALRELGH